MSTTIARDARITLALAGAIMTTSIGGVAWILTNLAAIEKTIVINESDAKVQLMELQRDILELRRDLVSVKNGYSDRWTGVHMKTWASLLKSSNPELKVPAVEEIR